MSEIKGFVAMDKQIKFKASANLNKALEYLDHALDDLFEFKKTIGEVYESLSEDATQMSHLEGSLKDIGKAIELASSIITKHLDKEPDSKGKA